MTFGSTWREMMRRSGVPGARAAWTYWSCLTTSTCPRTSLAIPAQPTSPTVTNTTISEGLERRDHRDEQQQRREGQCDVGEAHNEIVDPPPEIPGDEAKGAGRSRAQCSAR